VAIAYMSNLPFITRKPRPKQLSDPYNDHSPEVLQKILATQDDQLDWGDYRNLLGPHLPAGTYDEVVYFLPLAFAYIFNHEDTAFEMIDRLIGFVSINTEKLKQEGLLDVSRQVIADSLMHWTREFHIRHLSKAECQAKGWGLDYSDWVVHSSIVCAILSEIIDFEVHADIAEQFVDYMADHCGNPVKASWYLELARANHDVSSFAPIGTSVSKCLSNQVILRSAADLLLPEIIQADSVSTYWNDTFLALGL
jgi:hypothetical protein